MAQEPDEVTCDSAGVPAVTAASPPVNTEEIRAQIEETRADMRETIDAIKERLSPSRLMTHAKETVKEATVGRVKDLAHRASDTAADLAEQSAETGAKAVRIVRNNPVPPVLVAVGMAATWLFVRALKRSRNGTDYPSRYAPQDDGARTGRNLGRRRAGFLIGVAAGAACSGAWKAQNSSRFPIGDDGL